MAMLASNTQATTRQYNSMDRAPHSLHECTTVEEFALRFQASTGRSVGQIIDQIVASSEPRAVFLVGSLPLGMASSGSDVDLIVLVDSKAALLDKSGEITNTGQRLVFSNESDFLRASEFLAVVNGILVDAVVVVTPSIKRIYARLRNKGPELSETEIATLSRLSTGWLLWESEGYLEHNGLTLRDSALDVYCCTRYFVSALHHVMKGRKALDPADVPLALHLGRSAIEMAYLAYFASEGISYLGAKWLVQIGYARGAAERVSRHPLLKEGVGLLFPSFPAALSESERYFKDVAEFVTSMRKLIEQKTLFRIAFNACPQVVPVA
jgi:hypothetical protein